MILNFHTTEAADAILLKGKEPRGSLRQRLAADHDSGAHHLGCQS